MIAESYDLITDSPTKRIYEAVKRIPKGHVATYGKVAEMAGNPKMSRAVGNALHKNPDPEHIPCFRVVNSKGELAGAFAFGGDGAQAKLLEADGVEVVNGKVDTTKNMESRKKEGSISLSYGRIIQTNMEVIAAICNVPMIRNGNSRINIGNMVKFWGIPLQEGVPFFLIVEIFEIFQFQLSVWKNR